MKKLIIWVIGLFYAFGLSAQDYQWAGSVAGPSFQYGNTVAVDGQGNVITMGYLRDSADFDPSGNVLELVAQGSYDLYVQKVDPNGNLLWAERFGGNDNDQGYDMVIDQQDNIWVTGEFRGTVDFDPSPTTNNLTSAGTSDIFILKLAPNGSYLWAGQIGGSGFEKVQGIAADSSGNIYLTGAYYGNIDFDPTTGVFSLNSNNIWTTYVMKITSSGNLAWVKSMDTQGVSNSKNRGYSIAIDSNGEVVVTGTFAGTVDFDPGPGTLLFTAGSTSFGDVFVQKLDANGNLVWARQIAGTDFKEVRDLAVDGNNRISLIGAYTGTVDFDPGTGSQNQTTGITAIYVLQLDGNGNFNWVNSYEGFQDPRGLGIAVDRFGFVYHTGIYIGTVDFDPSAAQFNLTPNGAYDSYLQKLNPSGGMVWTYSLGSGDTDAGNDVTLDQFTNIYATGYFSTTTDFDPGSGVANLTSAGERDAYTLKWSQCSATLESISVSACETYTVPSGGETYSNSGIYFDTLQNTLGCDSFLTINLTITNATSASETATACGSYNWNGTTFTTSGTYFDTLQNVVGCDSFLTLNLTINNATTSLETATACGNYNWNGASYTNSGTYLDTIQNAEGCDSMMTLNLMINNETASMIQQTTCDSYTSPSGNYTWDSTGFYMDTIPNQSGCDSIISIQLVVVAVDTSVSMVQGVLTANLAGATYEWIDCSTGMAIPRETGQSFNPINSGSYAVVVQFSGCQDTSGCQQVTVVGTDPNQPMASWEVYPNPNEGQFKIEWAGEKPSEKMMVFNAQGQLIHTQTLEKGSNLVQLPTVAVGIYFVRISGGRHYHQKQIWVR